MNQQKHKIMVGKVVFTIM